MPGRFSSSPTCAAALGLGNQLLAIDRFGERWIGRVPTRTSRDLDRTHSRKTFVVGVRTVGSAAVAKEARIPR
ncbi:hypothetical protein A4248_10730 [Streptococcus pneumoniae]|nr:hypothetical protein A4248_10730 [Streptococcus pneumoniae]